LWENEKTADVGCFFILFNADFACELALVYQAQLLQDIAAIGRGQTRHGAIVLVSFLGGLFPSLSTPP